MSRSTVLAGLLLLALPGSARADVTLVDPLGYLWDIDDDDHGEVTNGSVDAYDSWPELCVTADLTLGIAVSCPTTDLYDADGVAGTLELGGREVVTAIDSLAGLEVHRRLFVPDTGSLGFLRYQEVLVNTGTTAVTVKVRVGTVSSSSGDLGSDSSTLVIATSDGSGALGADLLWFTTDDSTDGGGDPSLAHVLAGAGAPVGVATALQAFSSLDSPMWEYDDLTVGPGEQAIVVHFQSQQPDRASAGAIAVALENIYAVPEALEGMTAVDFARVVNHGSVDSDGDGLLDYEDNCPVDANAGQDDDDTDGVGDVCDACPGHDDTLDADLDGVPDDCDICPDDPLDDADADGVCDGSDNCPGLSNAGQLDADTDGVGDDCDLCPGHDDTLDTDADGTPDGCDACPQDDPDDYDLDGVCTFDDNCPVTPNSGQEDADTDGYGDACDRCAGYDDAVDTDADGVPDGCDPCPDDDPDEYDDDGVCHGDDNCPYDDNAGQEDADSDGIGDACDLCPAGDDLVDTDDDAVPDACDPCPDDALDDSDDDGVCDSDDLCAGGDDAVDTDSDGQPDDCDSCPLDDPDDTDSDGLCDSDDPCPDDPSADSDGDGVCDSVDECPAGDDAVDTDGDGIADWCDLCSQGDDAVDGDEDGLPDACDPCPDNADPLCTESDDDDDDDEGCGCHTGSAPATGLLVLLPLLVVRRRR